MTKGSEVAGVHSVGSKGGADEYFNYARPEITKHVSPQAKFVLDVGCGSGAVGRCIKNKNAASSVDGIEYFEQAAKIAKKYLDNVFEIDLNLLDPGFSRTIYDAIICGDVLEHLLSPQNTLKALRKKIKKDGTLICSIPNTGHWSVIFPLILDDRFTYRDEGLLDRTHVHLFTLREALILLQECGWSPKIIECKMVPLNSPAKKFSEEYIDLICKTNTTLSRKDALQRLESFQYIIVCDPA